MVRVKTTDTVFLVLAAGTALVIWSLLFSHTYRYSFYWDDLHLVRPYSMAELLSTWHGPTDPDGVETPALRPVGTALWTIQAYLGGDNVVIQRIGMALLMAALMLSVGRLLTELGLLHSHIVIVFTLFVASRAFSSIILWPTISPLILCYVLYVHAIFCALRWMKGGCWPYLLGALGCAIAGVLTREEAMTAPIVLAVLGGCGLSSHHRGEWRRLAVSVGAMAVIVSCYLVLRTLFVPDAPTPQISSIGLSNLLTALRSSWRPGGFETSSGPEFWTGVAWEWFAAGLTVALACFGRHGAKRQCVVAVIVGFALCLPAVGVARSFGLVLPTLAFLSAFALATVETIGQIARQGHRWRPAITFGVVLFASGGISAGVAAGMIRSRDVAASFDDNCARKILRDGRMLFDLYEHPVTIPAARRTTGLARLASVGITSPAALERLRQDVENDPGRYRITTAIDHRCSCRGTTTWRSRAISIRHGRRHRRFDARPAMAGRAALPFFRFGLGSSLGFGLGFDAARGAPIFEASTSDSSYASRSQSVTGASTSSRCLTWMM